MKTFLITLLLSFPVFAKNVMILGDSHTVGPFGKILHKNLSKDKGLNIALYGHASSAAFHWVSSKRYKLGGGVTHLLSVDGKRYNDPKDTHWSVKRTVPYIEDILSELAYNKEWKKNVGKINPIDTVVVALGANDLAAVASKSGKLNKGSVRRQEAISKMIDKIDAIGAKCLWIGPPNGTSKEHTEARQNTLYKFLKSTIGKRCEFFSSNHFKAKKCDKIHFNCKSEIPVASKWAEQATKFVLDNL